MGEGVFLIYRRLPLMDLRIINMYLFLTLSGLDDGHQRLRDANKIKMVDQKLSPKPTGDRNFSQNQPFLSESYKKKIIQKINK